MVRTILVIDNQFITATSRSEVACQEVQKFSPLALLLGHQMAFEHATSNQDVCETLSLPPRLSTGYNVVLRHQNQHLRALSTKLADAYRSFVQTKWGNCRHTRGIFLAIHALPIGLHNTKSCRIRFGMKR